MISAGFRIALFPLVFPFSTPRLDGIQIVDISFVPNS
jgi:hypothetical protein